MTDDLARDPFIFPPAHAEAAATVVYHRQEQDGTCLACALTSFLHRAEHAEALAARYKAALRDLLDGIPVETAAADPPLQAWMATLAEEP